MRDSLKCHECEPDASISPAFLQETNMGDHHDFHHYQRRGHDGGLQAAIVVGGTQNDAFQDEVYPPPMRVVQNPGMVSPYPDTDPRVYSSPAVARPAEIPMQAVPAPAPVDYQGNVVQPRYMVPPTDYRSYPLGASGVDRSLPPPPALFRYQYRYCQIRCHRRGFDQWPESILA